MTNVPKLGKSVKEDTSSLINKVTHYIRTKRQCLSIIHSDILSARRISHPHIPCDSIEVLLAESSLAKGLLTLEFRTLPPGNTSIHFRKSLDLVGPLVVRTARKAPDTPIIFDQRSKEESVKPDGVSKRTSEAIHQDIGDLHPATSQGCVNSLLVCPHIEQSSFTKGPNRVAIEIHQPAPAVPIALDLSSVD